MKIHEKLKARRLELGLTLEEVAARVGVNDSTISRWERGDIANMKRDKILKYAEALDISEVTSRSQLARARVWLQEKIKNRH